MVRWGRLAAAYLAMGTTAIVIALVWRDGWPFSHPHPWLMLSVGTSHAYSTMLGIGIGGLVVILTRPLVTRFAWARGLHLELRQFARGFDSTAIVTLAVLSALGEELLFRGLLHPWLGLWPQALIFGLVHQLPGKSRWVWVAWASLMGLVLGGVFELTGSLAGPVVAHALINGLNLQYLKTYDPDPQQKPLGGLLGQRS